MRLSEAIALGRTLAKPWEHGNRGEGRKCALQLAGLAANGNASDWLLNLPDLTALRLEIPCKCLRTENAEWINRLDENRTLSFRQAVMHVFNHHVVTAQDWTFDQLIDWVRSVEPAETPAPELNEGASSLAEARPELVGKKQ